MNVSRILIVLNIGVVVWGAWVLSGELIAPRMNSFNVGLGILEIVLGAVAIAFNSRHSQTKPEKE